MNSHLFPPWKRLSVTVFLQAYLSLLLLCGFFAMPGRVPRVIGGCQLIADLGSGPTHICQSYGAGWRYLTNRARKRRVSTPSLDQKQSCSSRKPSYDFEKYATVRSLPVLITLPGEHARHEHRRCKFKAVLHIKTKTRMKTFVNLCLVLDEKMSQVRTAVTRTYIVSFERLFCSYSFGFASTHVFLVVTCRLNGS